MLLLGVEHEDRVGGLGHGAQTTEVALELGELTIEEEGLLLDHDLELTDLLLALELEHLADALGDGAEIGEHAAEPALVHIGHVAAVSGLADRVLGLLLGADEQDGAAIGCHVAHEVVGGLDAAERLVEIDDVDAIALTEDETLHLRVPTPGLVPEVGTCLDHLAHRDDSHGNLLFCGCPPIRAPKRPQWDRGML